MIHAVLNGRTLDFELQNSITDFVNILRDTVRTSGAKQERIGQDLAMLLQHSLDPNEQSQYLFESADFSIGVVTWQRTGDIVSLQLSSWKEDGYITGTYTRDQSTGQTVCKNARLSTLAELFLKECGHLLKPK
jgi:hypothetical protein